MAKAKLKRKAKPKVEPLMFLGKRITAASGVQALFKDTKGERWYFKNTRGLSFGEVVEMTDDKILRRPIAIKSDWKPTEKDETEYEAQKIILQEYLVRRRKEMHLKRPHGDIVAAVNLLRRFYLPMNNWDRSRFMVWVAHECSKRKKK